MSDNYRKLGYHSRSEMRRVEKMKEGRTCKWRRNRDYETFSAYSTDCGREPELDNSYTARKFKYCPFCRREIEVEDE